MNITHPGCAGIRFTGVHGRPASCGRTPTHTATIRWPQRRAWVRIFVCDEHTQEVDDVEPMRDEHRRQLDERRRQVAEALRGQPYTPPPTSPRRSEV